MTPYRLRSTAAGLLVLALASVGPAQRRETRGPTRDSTPDVKVPAPASDAAPPTLSAKWISALQWRSIGPANMGGRISAIAVYENDPCIWYIATASGGLLKTINNGITFEHQFDHESTVSIGDVAVAQSDSKIVWVGTGEANPRNSVSWGDGVYKSADGGKTWKNMGLRESFQTGRIAIHPTDPNVVYVGALGRLWGPNEQRGLFKTTDGGENWEKVLFINDDTGVIDVVMHPEEPDTLLVATYERQRDGFDTNDPARKWGDGSGLHKTTDGGKTWKKISKGLPGGKLGRIGLDYYRKNPDTVYMVLESEKIGKEPENAAYFGIRGEDAEVGARLTDVTKDGPAEKAKLKVGDIVVAVAGTTVHSYNDMLKQVRKHVAGDKAEFEVSRDRKSILAEVTFTKRPETNGNNENARGTRGARGRRRRGTRSAFSASLGGQRENLQEQQGPDGHEYGGVYKSTDGGESWMRINSVNPRPMYFSEIRVDPSDDNYLYVLGVSLYRSKDGGKTFTSDGGRGVHADHHALWIDPKDGRHMILGNDGGVYVTCDRMERWDHLNHMAIGQFYHVTVGPRRNYRVYGGLQDNGSWGGPSRSRTGGGPINEDWIRIGGGDGFVCRVDENDPDEIYFESQNGGMGRINLRTGERGFIRPRGQRGQRYRFNWKTPFVLSSHNSRIYYTAGNYVLRSLDRGQSLKTLSPEITRTKRGSATALAESPLDSDVLYVGTDDGALWGSRDGGYEWTKLVDFPGDLDEKTDDAADADNSESGSESDERASSERGERRARPEGRRRPDRAGERGERPQRREGRGARGGRGSRMIEMLKEADANKDGKITRDEMPERMLRMFDRLDSNEDGVIDEQEIKAMSERRGGRRGQGGRPPGDRPPGGRGRRGDGDPPPAETDPPSMAGPAISDIVRFNVDAAALEVWQDAPDDVQKETEKDKEKAKPKADAEPKQEEPKDEPAKEKPAADAEQPETKAEEPAAKAAEQTPNDDPVSGDWKLESQGGGGPGGGRREFSMSLKLAADGTVTGTFSSMMGEGDITDGKFDRDTKKLTLAFDTGRMMLDLTGTIDGSKMTGDIDVGGGRFGFDFEAVRTKAAIGTDGGEAAEKDEGQPLTELLPGPRWVSSIETSRVEAGRVYVTFDGHRSNDDEPYVFVSENYGKTWRSLRANLPTSAGSTRVVREDLVNANVLYLGTEFGAWVTVDRGESWTKFNSNLPTVAVHEFAQHATSGEIVAGTHGRSLWVLDVTPLRQMTTQSLVKKSQLYKPNAAIYWRPEPRRGGGGARRFVGKNPASGAHIYYSLKDGADRVTLKITDPAGETIRELEAKADAGLHHVAWDLRRTPDERGRGGFRPGGGRRAGAAFGRGGGRAGGRGGARGGGGFRGRRGGRGRLVPSGTYRIVLAVDGQTLTSELSVQTDPDFPDYRAWEVQDMEAEFDEIGEGTDDRDDAFEPDDI